MIKVGITGGIGTGKSTVCKIIELLGIPVYYADEEAKSILSKNEEVRAEVEKLFGKEIVLSDGSVDRKVIAKIVFTDKDKLQKLNGIIHPAVAKHFEDWVLVQKHVPYILKEAAILFESGANKKLDKIIVVTSPKELRIKRIIKRDKATIEDIEKRMKNQTSEQDLITKADFVITNDETVSVIEQVLNIHRLLLK